MKRLRLCVSLDSDRHTRLVQAAEARSLPVGSFLRSLLVRLALDPPDRPAPRVRREQGRLRNVPFDVPKLQEYDLIRTLAWTRVETISALARLALDTAPETSVQSAASATTPSVEHSCVAHEEGRFPWASSSATRPETAA